LEVTRVIGVDVGGTKILAGVVERDGSVVTREERATPTRSQDELLAALDAAVEALLMDHGDVVALGFGMPSRIDQRTGRVDSSTNLPLADLDFRERMRERFSREVGLDNDANAAVIAEWQVGAGRGSGHVVMLTLGTGIGGGLILDGRPYRGSIGSGAELGHIVIEHDGPPCHGDCTGHGHLEALAAGTSADVRARELFGPASNAHDLVRRAREGDEPARDALADIGRKLGSGIGSLLNIFNPEVVIIGGGFAAAGELLLGPAREVAAREAVSPNGDARIVPAELGAQAGLVGAGFVAFEALDGAAE
jgi:glucokinase